MPQILFFAATLCSRYCLPCYRLRNGHPERLSHLYKVTQHGTHAERTRTQDFRFWFLLLPSHRQTQTTLRRAQSQDLNACALQTPVGSRPLRRTGGLAPAEAQAGRMHGKHALPVIQTPAGSLAGPGAGTRLDGFTHHRVCWAAGLCWVPFYMLVLPSGSLQPGKETVRPSAREPYRMCYTGGHWGSLASSKGPNDLDLAGAIRPLLEEPWASYVTSLCICSSVIRLL